jgi:hypothetical protein
MTDETNLQPETAAEGATPAPETEPVNVESPPTTDAQDNAETDAESQDRPKGGFQRRIQELTRNWREEQRRNDELLAILRSNQAQPARAEAPEVPPTLESVGFDETKYQHALIEFATKRAEAAAEAKIQSWQQQQQTHAKVETFKSREAAFADAVEDYAEVVYDPTAPISQPMAEVIQESDVGPQLAYYLAKNRDEAAKIAALSPIAAARALGRIEAKLATPAPTPVAPKAPPPPPKVETSPEAIEDDPDKMSIDKWIKWREKQVRRQGR